jgi:archaetidylinositol phosphate synthase
VVLNWFGDSLDGTLARYRKIERHNYGFYIDHAVDSLDEVLVFLALGLSPYVRMELAGLALVAYLLMSIQVFLYNQVKSVFQISFARIGPTEIRCLMILSNTLVFFIGNPTVRTIAGIFTFYDFVMVFLSLLLFGGFIVITILRARELEAFDTTLLAQKAAREAHKVEREERRAERKRSKLILKNRRRKDRGAEIVGVVNINAANQGKVRR